jgi:pimeloyl-ACP methyl ester carboxylesterase
VVFLHGQPGAATDWAEVIQGLPTTLRTFAWDRPGYRASPHPPGTLQDNARWLLAELDDAGIADAVLVGHSYGGGVALTTAAIAPHRVRGLVLVSSIGPQCLDGWDRLLAAPIAGGICALAAWWLTPWVARKRVARIERLRGRPLEPGEFLNWESWGNARHDHGAMWRTFLIEQRDLVHNLDALEVRLALVAAPTLILADPTDKMIPLATAYALQSGLRDSRVVPVSDGGHNLPRRNPATIASQIARFCAALNHFDA